jgi:8-oxo-dGTP pyrophosphatase MutT (NUDIX family)
VPASRTIPRSRCPIVDPDQESGIKPPKPDGRVDAADFAASSTGLEYQAALKAAVRETEEEAGILLREELLIHVAHWTTPPRLPRRFCTWFFVYPLAESVTVQVDNDEILEHRWITPAQALSEAEQELLILPRPTTVTLQDLAPHQTLAQLVEAVTESNIRVFPEDSLYYQPRLMGCQEPE